MQPIGAVDVLYQPARGSCATPAEALAEMDAAGVAIAMVSQCKQWSCERQWMCAETRLEDVARFVNASIRFAGLAGYNPFDATESAREMEVARALGFRGAYLNTANFGLRFSDARLYPLFAKAAELGQPAVVQVPLAEPDLVRCVERIGGDFPELSLALVHPRPAEEMFALCGKLERLAYVLDTSALAWTSRQARLVDDPAVVERCLWGSNGAPLATAVEEAMGSKLSREDLESILRTNALHYFAAAAPERTPQSVSNTVTVAER